MGKGRNRDEEMVQPDFLSIPEVAKLCGVTRNTVYIWAKKGQLSTYKTPGKTNLVRPSDLVEFMQMHGMYVPPRLQDRARQDNDMDGGVSNENSVLIVDDDPMVRGMIVQVLNNLYPLCQAQTGYEALHLITMRKDIKLVLLDIRMPGQGGQDTYEEIKKMRPDVSVIIVSGYIEDVPGEMMADSQVKGVIEKPVDEETLVEVVDSAMLGDTA